MRHSSSSRLRSAEEPANTSQEKQDLSETSSNIYENTSEKIDVLHYLDLTKNYNSSSDIAKLYNKTIHLKYCKIIIDESETLEETFKKKALKIIEIYNENIKHEPYHSFEIASLSSLDNETVSSRIYQSLVEDTDTLYQNTYKAEAAIEMLNSLPINFLLNNSHLILKTLKSISTWLKKGDFKADKGHTNKLIPILELYAKMLDLLIDNEYLKSMTETNNNSHISKVLSDYRNKIISKNFGACTFTLKGAGLKKGTQKALTEGINILKDNPHTHIKYLYNYIVLSIKDLPEEHKNSASSSIRRAFHLMMGTSSLCLMLVSAGGSLSDFQEMFKHFSKAISNNKQDTTEWHKDVRNILALISEAESNVEKMLSIITTMQEDSAKNPSQRWELTYIVLKQLRISIEKIPSNPLKASFLNLIVEIIMNEQFKSEVCIEAIETLISYLDSSTIEIKQQARAFVEYKIQNEIKKDRFNSLPIDLRESLEKIADVRSSCTLNYKCQANTKSTLFEYANPKVCPIEEKITKMRGGAEEDFNEKIKSYKENHIPLTAINNDEIECDLEDKVELFTEVNAESILVIHGGVGSGKSSFGRYLENKYWNEYITQGGTIPLFVELKSITTPQSNVIEQALEEKGFLDQDIIALKRQEQKAVNRILYDDKANKIYVKNSYRKPRLLFILDGYDEINYKINIRRAYNIKDWNSIKIIVFANTSEHNYVKDRNIFFGKNKKKYYNDLLIKPLDEAKISSFFPAITNKISHQIDKNIFDEFISKYEGIEDLASNPLILGILIKIFSALINPSASLSAIKEREITRYELYDLILDDFLNTRLDHAITEITSTTKGFDPKKSPIIYATEMAKSMFCTDKTTLGTNDKDNDDNLSLVIGPFQLVSDSEYSFIHSCIREFFVAKVMLDEIKAIGPNKDYDNLISKSIINQQHIQRHPGILSFLLDKINDTDQGLYFKYMAGLEKIIISTRKDTINRIKSSKAIAAANAATIYVRANKSRIISARDWSYVQIPGADISHASFYKMNFTGSNWSQVVAKGLEMRFCKCDNMQLPGFDLGEELDPFKKAHTIRSIYVNSRYVLLGMENKNIDIWDIYTQKHIRSLVGHENEITSLYANDEYFFSGSNDCSVRTWNIENGECASICTAHTEPVNSVCANTSKLFSAGKDNLIVIRDLYSDNRSTIPQENDGSITSICANEKNLFSSGNDLILRIWGIEPFICTKVIKDSCWFSQIYVNNAFLFYSNYNGILTIYNLAKNSLITTAQDCKYSINKIYANNKYVFTGTVDGKVIIFNLLKGHIVSTLKSHSSCIIGIYASDDELISSDSSGVTTVWNIQDMCDIQILKVVGENNGKKHLHLDSNEASTVYGVSDSIKNLFKKCGFKATFEIDKTNTTAIASSMLDHNDKNISEPRIRSDKGEYANGLPKSSVYKN